MEKFNYESFVGQPVVIRLLPTVGAQTGNTMIQIQGRLQAFTEYGLIVSSAEGAAERFSNRLFPWSTIAHTDFGVANARAVA